MTYAQCGLLSAWIMGAGVVIQSAPACNLRWWSPIDRVATAAIWPLMAAASSAHKLVSERPRTVWCRDGSLVWYLPEHPKEDK